MCDRDAVRRSGDGGSCVCAGQLLDARTKVQYQQINELRLLVSFSLKLQNKMFQVWECRPTWAQFVMFVPKQNISNDLVIFNEIGLK